MTDVANAKRKDEVTLSRTSNQVLGPPFTRARGWQQVPCPDPQGCWTYCTLNDDTGFALLQMGTDPHPPTTPLRICWSWTGWKKPHVYAGWNTVFCAVLRTGPVTVRGNGGTCVPRAFISLHPEGGGRPIENSVILSSNRTHVVCAVAPRPGYYTVGVSINIRSAFQGSADPYCEIIGTFEWVTRGYTALQAADLPAEIAGIASHTVEDADMLHEDREFGDAELLEQLNAFRDAAEAEVVTGPPAFRAQ